MVKRLKNKIYLRCIAEDRELYPRVMKVMNQSHQSNMNDKLDVKIGGFFACLLY